jgi:hypothetical protein
MIIFSNGHSGGVGVLLSADFEIHDTSSNQINGAGSAFYEADMRAIEQTFKDAYVEFYGLRDGMGAVPYLPESWFDQASNNQLCYFSEVWFKKFINGGGTPPISQPHNYFHLMGASKKVNGLNYTNGLSWSLYDWAYIFVDSINDVCDPCTEVEKRNHIQETTCHEIAHQFDVNSGNLDGHCFNNAWCDGDPNCINEEYGFEYCIMHAYNEEYSLKMRKDGIVKMDCDDLNATGQGCGLEPCSNGISVRTDVDPE